MSEAGQCKVLLAQNLTRCRLLPGCLCSPHLLLTCFMVCASGLPVLVARDCPAVRQHQEQSRTFFCAAYITNNMSAYLKPVIAHCTRMRCDCMA